MVSTKLSDLTDQEKYHLLADTAYDWEDWIGPDGEYVYVSPSCERITGYTSQAFLENPRLLKKITHPSDRLLIEQHCNQALEGKSGTCEMEFRIIRRDGGVRWINHCCQPVYHTDGSWLGHRSSNRDVTERVHAEAELRRLASVVEQVEDSVIITNTDYEITFINKAAESLFGYTQDELIGKKPDILNAEPQAEQIQQSIYETVSRDGVWLGEHLNRRKDGSTFVCEMKVSPMIDEHGNIYSFIGVQRDVTIRRQNEIALQESLDTIKTLINAPTDIAILVDVEGNILIASEVLAQRAGLSADELTGVSAWDLFPPEMAAYRKGVLEQVIQSGKPVRHEEKGALGATSTIYDTIVYPIQDANGRVTRVAIIARDITERKAGEEALRQRDALLRNLILNAPVTLLTVDAGGTITLLAGEELSGFGLDPDIAVGQNAFQFFSYRPHIVKNIRRALEGEEVGELVNSEQGQTLETRYAPIRNGDGEIVGVTGVGINVSEHVHAREELRQSRNQLEVILEGIADGIYVLDATGNTVYTNPAAARQIGFPSVGEMQKGNGTIIDFEIFDENSQLLPPDLLAGLLALNEVDSPPAVLRFRARGTQNDRWIIVKATPVFNQDGDVQMTVLIANDITDLKKAEFALKKSEERYRALVETSPDGIALGDLAGCFLAANRQFVKLFGYDSLEEMQASGLTYFDLVVEEDRSRVTEIFEITLENGFTQRDEYNARRKDGTLFPVEVSATIIPDTADKPPAIMVICRDITNRKRVQQELQKAHDILEQRVKERTAELRAEIIERRRAEAQIRRHAAHAEALARVAARTNAQLDVQAVLQAVCEEAIQAIPSMPGAVVRLYDDQFENLYYAAAHGPLSDLGDRIDPLPNTLHEHYANDSSSITVIPDITVLSNPHMQPLIEQRVRSIVDVVLRYENELIGTLTMTSLSEPYLPTESELALLMALADQAAVAIANARLFEQVSASRERLQTLSQKLVEIQETERQNLARELHDEIGGMLTSLNLKLDMVMRSMTEQDSFSQIQSELAHTQALVNQLLGQVRDMSLDLRPALLDDLGLLPALLSHFERYTEQTGVQVAFKHSGLEGRFPPEVEITAFRIVQEALTNIARHAKVDQVAVRLWANPQILALQVEDQGAGFDPQAVRSVTTTGGLSSMAERAVSCGGDFEIESTPGGGTILTAELPLNKITIPE